MVVVGGGRRQRRAAEFAVVDHAEVGDTPALCVHGVENIGLHQHGQLQILGGEGPIGVVAGHAAGVERGTAGVDVQAAARAEAAPTSERNSTNPSSEPSNALLARSGCGMSPTTLPASLAMPAMASIEPLGLSA